MKTDFQEIERRADEQMSELLGIDYPKYRAKMIAKIAVNGARHFLNEIQIEPAVKPAQ